jgi:hypothetical protein
VSVVNVGTPDSIEPKCHPAQVGHSEVISLIGNSLFNQVKSLPSGLLAVCGSFLLFGLGTLMAWTKSKWTRTVEKEP